MNKDDRKIEQNAKNALLEAKERKKILNQKLPKEIGGRKGLEATRYGDWEKKGIISDF